MIVIGDSLSNEIHHPRYSPNYVTLLGANSLAQPGASTLQWLPGWRDPDGSDAPGLWQERIAPLTLHKRELIFVWLGRNDGSGFIPGQTAAEPAEWLARMEVLLDALYHTFPSAVLATASPPPAAHMTDRFYRARAAHYASLLTTAPPRSVSHVIDLYSLLDPELHFHPNDPHPNPAGHRAIAEILKHNLL